MSFIVIGITVFFLAVAIVGILLIVAIIAFLLTVAIGVIYDRLQKRKGRLAYAKGLLKILRRDPELWGHDGHDAWFECLGAFRQALKDCHKTPEQAGTTEDELRALTLNLPKPNVQCTQYF